jgi:hypothetical protein
MAWTKNPSPLTKSVACVPPTTRSAPDAKETFDVQANRTAVAIEQAAIPDEPFVRRFSFAALLGKPAVAPG